MTTFAQEPRDDPARLAAAEAAFKAGHIQATTANGDLRAVWANTPATRPAPVADTMPFTPTNETPRELTDAFIEGVCIAKEKPGLDTDSAWAQSQTRAFITDTYTYELSDPNKVIHEHFNERLAGKLPFEHTPSVEQLHELKYLIEHARGIPRDVYDAAVEAYEFQSANAVAAHANELRQYLPEPRFHTVAINPQADLALVVDRTTSARHYFGTTADADLARDAANRRAPFAEQSETIDAKLRATLRASSRQSLEGNGLSSKDFPFEKLMSRVPDPDLDEAIARVMRCDLYVEGASEMRQNAIAEEIVRYMDRSQPVPLDPPSLPRDWPEAEGYHERLQQIWETRIAEQIATPTVQAAPAITEAPAVTYVQPLTADPAVNEVLALHHAAHDYQAAAAAHRYALERLDTLSDFDARFQEHASAVAQASARLAAELPRLYLDPAAAHAAIVKDQHDSGAPGIELRTSPETFGALRRDLPETLSAARSAVATAADNFDRALHNQWATTLKGARALGIVSADATPDHVRAVLSVALADVRTQEANCRADMNAFRTPTGHFPRPTDLARAVAKLDPEQRRLALSAAPELPTAIPTPARNLSIAR